MCAVLPTCLVWLLLLLVVAVLVVLVCAVLCLLAANDLGKEGAQALGPVLAKLTQLQTLNLGCEYMI